MAAWIMACRICFQVIFFELFIGIFVLKDLFFSVIPDKDEESVGIKRLHSDSSLCSEQQFYFRKADLYRNTGLLQSNRFISERQNTIRLQKPGKFRRFLPSCHLVRKPLPSGPRCFPRFQGFNHQLGSLSGRDQVEYAVFQQAEETGPGFPAHVQVFHMDGGIVCFQ